MGGIQIPAGGARGAPAGAAHGGNRFWDLLFSFQKSNQIPIESHDQKLDWILTESYLYKAI